jgi:hypothetical protein
MKLWNPFGNCLVDTSCTMLDTEDRQDIMLDMDESFAHHGDECDTIPTSNLVNVDDSDDAFQFTDRLRGQHTAEEIMSRPLRNISMIDLTQLSFTRPRS